MLSPGHDHENVQRFAKLISLFRFREVRAVKQFVECVEVGGVHGQTFASRNNITSFAKNKHERK